MSLADTQGDALSSDQLTGIRLDTADWPSTKMIIITGDRWIIFARITSITAQTEKADPPKEKDVEGERRYKFGQSD
jgi:hypothetical protein